MNAAEFKTLRESLGLTLNWVAEQANVQQRTVQYWESGDKTPPDDVVAMLMSINNMMNHIVEQSVQLIGETDDETGGVEVSLVRYGSNADLWKYRPDFKPLPATCHAAMLSRTKRELDKIGIECTIVYMVPERYELWLKTNQLEDNETSRSAWAGLQ